MGTLARILRLFVSLPFLVVALLVALGWFTVSLYSKARAESERTVPTAAVRPKRETLGAVKQLGGKALELAVPPAQPAEAPKEIPPEIRKSLLAVPSALTLYSPAAAPAAAPPPAVSSRYLPYGTLIPCKLVNTVDSNSDGSPVIAIVLEDMRNVDERGVAQIVVPAGTLAILDATAPGRERDRISADGTWVLVWRTRDGNNGTELPVSARALSRDYNTVTGLFGAGDGRAGLRGEVIEDLGGRRIHAAAQAAVQGALAAAKEYDVTSHALTGQILRNPVPTLRNAALAGSEAYIQQYSDQIRERVQREGAFVQVVAGTEFYLFPRQTLDLRNARRGSMAVARAQAPSKK